MVHPSQGGDGPGGVEQALFQTPELAVTLLDTPGHVDFSAEMERTLQVLDYAILVISATDGVQKGGAVIYSPHLFDAAAQVEQPFGEGGLAGVHVGEDAHD